MYISGLSLDMQKTQVPTLDCFMEQLIFIMTHELANKLAFAEVHFYFHLAIGSDKKTLVLVTI
jgi:hypothetical protein